MAFWITLVVIAQFLNAFVVLADKYFLNRKEIPQPFIYAFYISLFSVFVLPLAPWVSLPTASVAGLSLFLAAVYIGSIVLLYSAIKDSSASNVVPIVGSFSAITTFLLVHIFELEPLPNNFVVGVILLVVGSFMVSRFRFGGRTLIMSFFSGVLFGMSAFLVKVIFNETTFLDGFFWSRMANVIGACMILLYPANYRAIVKTHKTVPVGTKGLVMANKALSGLAFVLILFAISLGTVSVINALAALQFVFLLAFGYLFAHRMPSVFHIEKESHRFHHKLFGIVLIVVGFFVLFL